MYIDGFQIDAVSDTHGQHGRIKKMRGGDLLIHAGDMTGRGTPEVIMQTLLWLEMQPYKHKVAIPGNHDFDFEKNPEFWKNKFAEHGVHLLNDSGVILKDMNDPAINIKVWGSPITPFFFNWAFNRHRGDDIKKHWDLIPADTEILVTHGPPEGIKDMCVFPDGRDREGVGCADLLTQILKTPSIKLHVFGHIHEARGYTYKHSKTFVNASSLDQLYCPVPETPTRIVRDSEGLYLVEE